MKTNPYIGKVAKSFSEMKRISALSRPYEGTLEGCGWYNVKTGKEEITNL